MAQRRRRRRLGLAAVTIAAVVGGLLLAVPQASPAQADVNGGGGDFVPLPQGRLVDTRTGVGISGTSPVGTTAKTFQISGVGGVPTSGVSAVLVDISEVQPSVAAVYLNLGADGSGAPAQQVVVQGVADTNFSNTAVVPIVNGKGKISATNGTSHVVIDVEGYFTSTSSASPGGFVPITANRTIDTRTNKGTTGGKLLAGTSRDITLATAGVPTNATAVYANVISVGGTRGGGIRISPKGATTGPTFDSAGGTSVSGMAIKLGANGVATMSNTGPDGVDVIVDVFGYFTPTGTAGAGFRPANGRLIDTRSVGGPIGVGDTRDFQVAGAFGMPIRSVAGVVLDVTAIQGTGGSGVLTVWPAGAAKPGISVSNAPGGTVRHDTIIVKPGTNGRVSINNAGAGPTNVILEVQGYFADPLVPLPVQPNSRITGLQRSGAADSVRPIDLAFTTNVGWLETARIPDPKSLDVNPTTFQLLSGSDTFTGTPSLAEGYDSKLTIAGHNTDSNVQLKTETVAGSSSWPAVWSKMGGSPISEPTLVKLSDNREIMLAVDPDGALWSTIQSTGSGGAWTEWRYLGVTQLLAGTLVVKPDAAAGAAVYARNTSGNLVTAKFTVNTVPTGVIGTWTDLGNPGAALDATAGPAVAVNGTQQRVFVRRADSTIWTKLFNGTTWSAWSQIPGITNAAGQPTAVLHPNNGTWQVLVRTTDGAIAWCSEVNAGSGTWTTWKSTFTGVITDPNVITWTLETGAKGWGIAGQNSNGDYFVGNYSTAIPPAPAGARSANRSRASTSAEGEPHLVILTPKK